MSVVEFLLDVGEETLPCRLNVPDEPQGRGIVVLPGGNHGPYGDVFDDFAEVAVDWDFHVLRYESWGDEQDPDEGKTLAEIHAEYEAAVGELFDRGCTRVDVVGKSFGGAVALTHVPRDVASMVLWAPAPKVVDDVDFETLRTTPMADLGFVRIDADLLGEVDVPVRVVFGDEDPIPTENFDRIVDGIEDVDRVVVAGGDHSFEGVEDETVQHTLGFLAR